MRKYLFSLIILLLTVTTLVGQRTIHTFAQAATPQGVCNNQATPVTAGGSWEKRASAPLHRSETAAAMLDGKIYIAGGLAGPSNFFTGISTSFEVYDPATDAWKELAPLP